MANGSQTRQGPGPDGHFPVPPPPSALPALASYFHWDPEMKIKNARVISHCHTHWEGECSIGLAFPDYLSAVFACLPACPWREVASGPPIGLKNIILTLTLVFVPWVPCLAFPDLSLRLTGRGTSPALEHRLDKAASFHKTLHTFRSSWG